tara:strand:- start:89 stop:385 length:297 start_codon:yes stop_codon:yes gene_type:complete
MNNEEEMNMPYITIDDVQISVDDLPDEAKGIFGRLQRLNQKKANLVLDLEELQAGINFFSGRIVDIVNNEGSSEETSSDDSEEDVDIEETGDFPPEED